jgi:hypothetical protein
MAASTAYPPTSAAAIVFKPLDDISSALDDLVNTLQTSTTYSALPAIADSLLSADDSLSSALTLLQQHQANHARILNLRAEADQLESDIRGIVRRARDLRNDITSIHPSIDSDDDSDGEPPPEVDYTQLLNFAARIGKHNAVAKQEAEAESDRLKLEALAARKRSEQLQSTQAQPAAASEDLRPQDGGADPATLVPDESQSIQEADKIVRDAAELTARAEASQFVSRLPFPAPELLRMGLLGQLQVLRESEPGDPEGAVDREVEHLVRETEDIAPSEAAEKRERDRLDREREEKRREEAVEAARREAREARKAEAEREAAGGAGAGASGPRPAERAQAKPKEGKLNLDLPGQDSDDDDED